MALFKIEKGLATNLLANRPNAVEGYCYFTTDDGKFYIDTKSGSLTGSNPTGTRVALNANYSSKLLFGEITQSSSSTLKVSTVNNLSSLVHGTIVVLKNNGSNTAANANLNINNLGSKPIYVNGNPITENTWRANEMAILFYDANSYSGTTGVWSLIPGVTYIHPQYTARTGVPTANQTPAFGGTFSVNQITSDTTGHVTAATSRTITIPSTLSNGTGTAGLIKTSSTVTSNSGYTACPVIDGVPYYKDTNTTYTLGSFGINATATELNYSNGLTGNIQSQLNNKSSSTHTHNYAGSSSAGGSANSAVKLDTSAGDSNTPVYFSGGKPVACTSLDLDTSGNAATATKLKTARTIGLNTGATGTATNFDGSGNIAIPVTSVKEAYLDWGGKNFSGTYGPIDAAMVPNLGANRLAFMPATGVEVQYSTNGGSTWQTYSTTNENKINLFNGNSTSYYIGASSTTGIDKSNYQLRIIITTNTAQVYTELNKFIIYCSTNGSSGAWCTIDGKTKANVDSGTDTWVTFANKISISGWSGYNVINTSKITTYGNTSAQYQKLRFTFGVTSHPSSSSYSGLIISKIMAFGGNGWTTPSTMAATGRMYTYDYAQNVTFPAKVTASQFNGTATTANKVANTLTIQGNGTTLTNGTFDGSAAKTVNITPASIGAATSSHTHDNRYYTESEIDNYNLITISEIDNICQIPTANITVNNRDCSSDISFEEARSYIENFGRLYVYVTGIGPWEEKDINRINTIYALENNNTLIKINNKYTQDWWIEWTSSQIEVVIRPPM